MNIQTNIQAQKEATRTSIAVLQQQKAAHDLAIYTQDFSNRTIEKQSFSQHILCENLQFKQVKKKIITVKSQ